MPTTNQTAKAVRPQVASNRRPVPKRQNRLATDAQHAKQLAQAAKYAKSLFNGEVDFLTPAQIVSILKACGVDVPHGAVVTAEMAQIIASGGALYTDVEAGADIASCASPAAATVKAITAILNDTGVVKGASKELTMVCIVCDVLMIIGSVGVNIGAWIDLAMNIYKMTEYLSYKHIDAVSQFNAESAVYDWFNARETKQRQFALSAFQDYQNGKSTCFDYIDEVAKRSPDLLLKMFPQLVKYVPQVERYYQHTSSASNYTLGIEQSSSYTFTYRWYSTQYNFKEIQNAIFQGFIAPTLRSYQQMIQNFPHELNFRDMALACMIPPYIQVMTPEMDFSSFLQTVGLTPNDLHSDIISKGIKSGEMFKPVKPLATPITYNGVEYVTPTQNAANLRAGVNEDEARQIFDADQRGDADTLFSFYSAFDYVNKWARRPYTADETIFKAQADQANLLRIDRGIIADSDAYKTWWLANKNLDNASLWRFPNQFVVALNMLHDMKQSKVFDNWNYVPAEMYNWFGLIDDYNEQHKKLTLLSTARCANLLAKQTIAYYLGTTADNIEPARPIETGKPTVWRKIK